MLIIQFLLIVVYYYMIAVSMAFLIRAVMSWIMPDGDNVFLRVAFFMTEAFIIPYRKLFNKMRWFEGSMFDVPFFAGSISVWFITMIVIFLSEGILV